MKKILLASVLKPLDDTRMFEKFGVSLAKEHQVTILGYGNSPPVQASNITFESLYIAKNKSIKRFFVGFTFLRKLLHFRPEIVVVHSPELLFPAACYCIITQANIIYDVRENYYNNIRFQPNYSKFIKPHLARLIRTLENFSPLFVKAFILAEKSYNKEFNFHKKRYLILENKFTFSPTFKNEIRARATGLNFIYCGTISEVYGIWEALHFIEKIHDISTKATLMIIGHVINDKLKSAIEEFIEDKKYISFTSGKPLVKHQRILAQMRAADFVLLSYQPNRSTAQCLPTKMFECIALQIPMVVQKNAYWEAFCKKYPAALFINFKNFDEKVFLNQLLSQSFYDLKPGEEVLWQQEEKKLLALIAEL